MVSPALIRSTASSTGAELNPDAKRLFMLVNSENKPIKDDIGDDTPKIRVSDMISRVSFFYEKLRNAVDYEEDYLLRKNAIFRILKRQIVIEGVLKDTDSLKIAQHLVTELIRAGYLPNNKIPETKIKETADLLEKYIKLKDLSVLRINRILGAKGNLSQTQALISEKNATISWLLALAACEIEESFGHSRVKQAMVSQMFDILSKHVELPESLIGQKADLEIQIYLSVSRTFLKFDRDMLSLILFKYFNATWSNAEKGVISEEDLRILADKLPALRQETVRHLDHSLVKPLDRIVRVYSLYFEVLLDTISADPSKTYNELSRDEKKFLSSVRKTCEDKYKKVKGKLWGKAFRSIVYIFLTKSIFVFLIEIPAIKWFGEAVNPVSLAINISFPAALLFFIVMFTSTPGRSNTDKIIAGVREITLSGAERKQPILIRTSGKRSKATDWFFNILYTAAFFVSTYFIIWALGKIHFNWVSITIFLFFLAFVSFFSIIVTKDVKNLIIVEKKDSLLGFLIDLFYMPIIAAGKWLSGNISKVNVFVFFFDFIIEAPFKVIVEIAEDWTRYVRERKDNML